MARKKVEKTPLSPKEAASKEFAMTSCVHSGDPSYRFEVGDSVSIGALKNCVVDEVCEDGRYYGISTEKMVHATAIGLGSMSDRFRLLWKQSMRRKIRLFSVCRSATVPSNRCSICTTTLVWTWNPDLSARFRLERRG